MKTNGRYNFTDTNLYTDTQILVPSPIIDTTLLAPDLQVAEERKSCIQVATALQFMH